MTDSAELSAIRERAEQHFYTFDDLQPATADRRTLLRMLDNEKAAHESTYKRVLELNEIIAQLNAARRKPKFSEILRAAEKGLRVTVYQTNHVPLPGEIYVNISPPELAIAKAFEEIAKLYENIGE